MGWVGGRAVVDFWNEQLRGWETRDFPATFNGHPFESERGCRPRRGRRTELGGLRQGISTLMYKHMRTTIDVPDDLLNRVRPFLEARKMTFRALVIDALDRAIETPRVSFSLRDASVGCAEDDAGVSSEAINRAIDEARAPSFKG